MLVTVNPFVPFRTQSGLLRNTFHQGDGPLGFTTGGSLGAVAWKTCGGNPAPATMLVLSNKLVPNGGYNIGNMSFNCLESGASDVLISSEIDYTSPFVVSGTNTDYTACLIARSSGCDTFILFTATRRLPNGSPTPAGGQIYLALYSVAPGPTVVSIVAATPFSKVAAPGDVMTLTCNGTGIAGAYSGAGSVSGSSGVGLANTKHGVGYSWGQAGGEVFDSSRPGPVAFSTFDVYTYP